MKIRGESRLIQSNGTGVLMIRDHYPDLEDAFFRHAGLELKAKEMDVYNAKKHFVADYNPMGYDREACDLKTFLTYKVLQDMVREPISWRQNHILPNISKDRQHIFFFQDRSIGLFDPRYTAIGPSVACVYAWVHNIPLSFIRNSIEAFYWRFAQSGWAVSKRDVWLAMHITFLQYGGIKSVHLATFLADSIATSFPNILKPSAWDLMDTPETLATTSASFSRRMNGRIVIISSNSESYKNKVKKYGRHLINPNTGKAYPQRTIDQLKSVYSYYGTNN